MRAWMRGAATRGSPWLTGQARFAECDFDRNGKLKFDEFVCFCAPMMADPCRSFEQVHMCTRVA